MKNVFVCGLREGYNYPSRKNPNDKPHFDLTGCNEIILVDRQYFLDHLEIIKLWAIGVNDEP
jgi:hypothetical protein